jgi:ketosteroid isomerase-like protein
MTERDDFLAWVSTRLRDAEVALHNGDSGPRFAIWSTREPVTVFGAWRTATGVGEVGALFHALERSFSDCTSYEVELVAADVLGDLAYTVGYERTSSTVDGQPRRYVLRATQVYRREDGEWKVAHRHADTIEEGQTEHPAGP